MINFDLLSKEFFMNGFVKIDSFLNHDDISLIDKAISDVYSNPTPFRIKVLNDDSEFFMDFRNWERFESVKKVCLLPKLINLAVNLTGSKNCWLMHEDCIVKEGLAPETPIHHDRPYFIVKGDLNLSIWMSTSPVSKNESLVCYRKSHLTDDLYLPKIFGSNQDAIKFGDKSKDYLMPINEQLFNHSDAVSFDLNFGDIIVFHHKTVHLAPKHYKKTLRKSMVVRYILDGSTLTEKYFNDVPPYERMGLKISEGDEIPTKFFPKIY